MLHMPSRSCCAALRRGGRVAVLAAAALLPAAPHAAWAESSVTLGGVTLVNHGLVGDGRIDAALRDKFGETFGSGSGMAIDPKSWTRDGASWRGTIWLLPDRGYNVKGTIDYRSRLNRLEVVLTPPANPEAVPVDERQRSVVARLADTILLSDPAGAP